MTWPRLLGCRLLLATPLLLVAVACGDDDDADRSPAPSGALVGEISLEEADTLLSVVFAPGDLQAGAPSSVAAGDFNADGDTDLLLGAPLADGLDESRPDSGEAYVLFGPLGGEIDLASDEPAVRILGALSGDNLGAAVAVGDLNGDGVDDIVVGAPNSNGLIQTRTDMGEAYVIFGKTEMPATVDLAAREQDFGLTPAEGFSHLGIAFGIGDVNGDGTDDLVAGAPYAGRLPGSPVGSERTTLGEVYIVYGSSAFGGEQTVATDDQDVTIAGVLEYDQFGGSVALADTNGDRTLDIIIGASGYDGPGGEREGAGGAFVFHGGSHLAPRLTLEDADVTLFGAEGSDQFGTIVAAADLDGDGSAEVIASAPSAAGPANDTHAAGEVVIVSLSGAIGSHVDTGDAGSALRIYGPTSGELMPTAFASSQTGRIALGSAMRSSQDTPGGGYAYVISETGAEIDLAQAGAPALTIRGDQEGNGAGTAVAFADIDNDGEDELLLQAAGAPSVMGPDPNHSARLYVIRLDPRA